MNRSPRGKLSVALLLAALAAPAATMAQGTPAAPAPRPVPELAAPEAVATEGLSDQDREVLAWATQLSAENAQTIEKWLSSKAITEERLFSYLYYPIANSEPVKYTTDYDALADRDFQGPQEKTLGRSGALVYVVTADVNGYIPTHNLRYSMPLTGNRGVDLVNNRTKRIFADRTGFMASRNQAPYLLQRYKRDTGEQMVDLSVPIHVKGRHWGCVRIGYRRDEK